jgi:endo-1,3-1,4-beta-glycanase ExoK
VDALSYVPWDGWDPSRWSVGDHPLGRGYFQPANVAVENGLLLLKMPAGTYNGGEILTRSQYRYGVYEARMRVANAPGSLTAFFLYQGVRNNNDEIDIEIFGDATRTVMFTTWVRGRQTNHRSVTLPFDPRADFHDYRIEWERKSLRFYVDGALMATFTSGIPGAQMYVMANAWWPTWLTGGPAVGNQSAAFDWIRY